VKDVAFSVEDATALYNVRIYLFLYHHHFYQKAVSRGALSVLAP
jgi:hypothetical protein